MCNPLLQLPEDGIVPVASIPASRSLSRKIWYQTLGIGFSCTADPLKLGGIIVGMDLLTLLVSSLGQCWIQGGRPLISREIMLVVLLSITFASSAFWVWVCYTSYVAKSPLGQIGRATQACLFAAVVLVFLAVVTEAFDGFSYVWMAYWIAFLLCGAATVRLLSGTMLQKQLTRRRMPTAAVVDLADAGDGLARSLTATICGQMRLIGVFKPQAVPGSMNGVADLVALARLVQLDEIIVATRARQSAVPVDVLRRILTIPANIRICSDRAQMAGIPTEAAGQTVETIYRRPLMGWRRVVKRVEDLMVGTVALVAVTPVMAIISLLIKIDSPGPVLFVQKRPGLNCNVINVYKFRTMYHNRPPEQGVPQARRNDPRVTRVGRFLRRTSLDELPQLFNVLTGDMSLVGPRPLAQAHNDEYMARIDGYLGRHRVQPGITGWAQINGLRGETETLEKMRRRVELDLSYVENWSLLFDLRILFLTAVLTLFDRNAY